MRRFLVLLIALSAGPLMADAAWVLQFGPEATDAIPLVPVQPVPAWRGLYSDGIDRLWVYATASPNFFAPAVPEVREVAGTKWTVTCFFPKDWKPEKRTAWLDLWVTSFQGLATLPSPGWPVLFPSVLRKG